MTSKLEKLDLNILNGLDYIKSESLITPNGKPVVSRRFHTIDSMKEYIKSNLELNRTIYVYCVDKYTEQDSSEWYNLRCAIYAKE